MNEAFDKLKLTRFGAAPSDRQIRHLKYYNKKAFFHFGVNTFTNLEWGEGEETESIFNPSETDVRQWIKTIKAAGFTLALLTAKHHDGFCLWPSKYTEHSIKNSPYKNGKGDIVREFTDACHEFKIRCGIYLSPWDRHSPYWGQDEYSTYYNNQLTELLTNYGRIDEVWWDGAGSNETNYNWGMWAYTVRNLQPNAVIFGSLGAAPYAEMRWVGNENGYAGDTHYLTIDEESLLVENTAALNSGKFGGERFIPAEADVSIRPGWFYHKDQDAYVKTPKQLVDLWFNSVGRSAIMLLNFPPDRRGIIHEIDALNAIEANKIIQNTLAFNLASGARAASDSVRDISCEPDFMLDGNYDTFYAASDDNITPTIEITLPQKTTFDTFVIGEVVELGIRVRGYRAEAWADGEWKVLADKKSIGFKWAERFDSVTTDRVRIVIYDAACAPVIREFGLYKLPDCAYNSENEKLIRENVNLAEGESAKIIEEENGVLVEFGGIYPFNTVCFNAEGSYKLYAFDGSNYYLIHEESNPKEREIVRLEKTIDSSYKLRIETGKSDNRNLNIEIYEQM